MDQYPKGIGTPQQRIAVNLHRLGIDKLPKSPLSGMAPSPEQTLVIRSRKALTPKDMHHFTSFNIEFATVHGVGRMFTSRVLQCTQHAESSSTVQYHLNKLQLNKLSKKTKFLWNLPAKPHSVQCIRPSELHLSKLFLEAPWSLFVLIHSNSATHRIFPPGLMLITQSLKSAGCLMVQFYLCPQLTRFLVTHLEVPA